MTGVDLEVALLGGVVVLAASFLSGAVGFAYSLVALPLLLLVGLPLPDAVVVNLTVTALVRVVVVARFHREVDRRRAGLLVLAAVPGMALGTAVLAVVPVPVLEVAAGVTALVAVAALVLVGGREGGDGWEATRAHVAAAGALGGFLGATTSLNGIPPALLLARARTGATSTIADLAAYFLVGNVITLAMLTVAGTGLRAGLLPLLAAWTPVALVGNTLGVRFGRRLAPEVFRRLTLLVIVVSGVVSIARNL